MTMKRGTEVTIKLKQEESRFLDQNEVKSHMQTYATYFPYPIFIQTKKTVEREVEKEEHEEVKKEEEKEAKVESGEEGKRSLQEGDQGGNHGGCSSEQPKAPLAS